MDTISATEKIRFYYLKVKKMANKFSIVAKKFRKFS